MEGLEISEVSISALDLSDRADAEYVTKENLRIERLVRHLPHKKLGKLCELTASAFYPSATDLYGDTGLPFVRCVDCIDYPLISALQDGTFERLPESFVKENGSIRLVQRGDIVITKVGSPCYASLVHEHESLALSRTVLGATNIKDVDPYYLTVFLRSYHGFLQLMRQREQTIQFQLTLERVRDVDVFVPSSHLQEAVAVAFRRSLDFRKASREHLAQAEALLLQALGLDTWTPPEALSYVRSSRDAFAAGRLDAEHFHEKYYASREALIKAGAKRFIPLPELLLSITNGHTPLRHDLSVGDVPFLCAEHITDFNVDFGSEKRILLDHHQNELSRTAVYDGDVLLTIKGRIGNAAIAENVPGNININQDVALLRFNDALPLWYIVAYLNSRFGKLQSEKFSTGAINPFLGLFSIQNFEVPEFSTELMNSIATETRTQVISARQAKQRATRLLDAAKRAVEIAIEDSEAAALAYLAAAIPPDSAA